MPPRGPCVVARVTLVALVSAVVAVGAATGALAEGDDLRLPTPTYSETVRLWQSGHPEAALDDLEQRLAREGEAPLEALILRATLLADADRAEESELVWHEAIERASWIRTFARRAIVQSLAVRRHPDAAAPLLAELIESDAKRHRDLMLRVADAYRHSGRPDEAAPLYRRVIAQERRGNFADTARAGLAAGLEAAGDLDAALSLLRETRLLHWHADAYQHASEDQRRLADRLRRTPRPFEEAEYRLLARRLRNASRFVLARELIDEWRRTHPLTARPDRIEGEWIETLYAQRANEEAVARAQRFYERHSASSLVPRVRLTEFRLAVRMTDTERARRMGHDLWRGRVPGATAAQRRSAAVLLAAYLASVGDLPGSLELYRELFRTSQNTDDQRAYLWRAGVAALRDGQDERALTNLQALLDRQPSGDLAPAGLYWRGAAEQRHDAPTATRTFRAIDQRFPYHYYGIRARERLGQLTEGVPEVAGTPDLEFPALALSTASQGRAEYKAAMALARAGLTRDSAWYLRLLLDRQDRDSGLALLTARASTDADAYADASRIMVNYFGRFLRQPAHGLPDDFWVLIYPRPFWDEVRTAAHAAGVDPILLVSLMRQESRFDPEARSAVGAVGLFQIMPYTATALGEAAGLGRMFENGVDDARLIQPSINAAIAARLTANLLARFDGEIAPVIASYNAGEQRVAVWWSASSQRGEDVFVDSIPYSETRRFVREVLTNYAAYQRVYADQ